MKYIINQITGLIIAIIGFTFLELMVIDLLPNYTYFGLGCAVIGVVIIFFEVSKNLYNHLLKD